MTQPFFSSLGVSRVTLAVVVDVVELVVIVRRCRCPRCCPRCRCRSGTGTVVSHGGVTVVEYNLKLQ